jgi:hypothetical protein
MMRGKILRLEEALDCSFFTDQHAAALAMMLATIDHYITQIDQLTTRMQSRNRQSSSLPPPLPCASAS